MNTEERTTAISAFSRFLENPRPTRRPPLPPGLEDLRPERLPALDVVRQLLEYHQDVTGTINKAYEQVRGVIGAVNQLKNRKRNVQLMMDSLTSISEVRRLSWGLGTQPQEVLRNLQSYYAVKDKAYYVEKHIKTIETEIAQVERKYQDQFDQELGKANSASIAEVAKVLQLIRRNSHHAPALSTLEQLADYWLNIARKDLKKVQEDLFNVPIVGGGDSNYLFFDLAKSGMKIAVGIVASCKANVIKLAGQEGLQKLIGRLFGLVTGGLILQILMRLRKYYELQKVGIHAKGTLRDKQVKLLQPFFKEFNAIWNQVERLQAHLLAEFPQEYNRRREIMVDLQNTLSSGPFMDINSAAILHMQAMMRYRFDKLLKNSPFVTSLCHLDPPFFKDLTVRERILNNPQAQDFLEETVSLIIEGIQKALETLNTMLISAILNFINHHLIYQDAFFAFGELFSRTFTRLPSSDNKALTALILVLNALAAFPLALKSLHEIKLPQQIPQTRIRAQLQEVVNNNEARCKETVEGLLGRIVSAQWLRQELVQDHEKVVERWGNLEPGCFSRFVQKISQVHAAILLETEFCKKYSQVGVITFQKEVRGIVGFYERHSHSILPNFKVILDYIQVLMLDSEDEFRRLVKRYADDYSEAELTTIWALRN